MKKEKLNQLLDSSDENSILLAISKLENELKVSNIKKLIPFVSNSNQKIRKAALRAAMFLSKRCFLDKFKDLDEQTKTRLAQLLTDSDDLVYEVISGKLKVSPEDEKIEATKMLSTLFKTKKKEMPLKDFILKEESPKVKASLISLLGLDDSNKYLNQLLGLLEDKDPRIKANAIEVLEKIATSQMTYIFLKHTADSSNRVRANSIKALYKLGYLNIYKFLEEMILSKENLMRASAVWVLGEITDLGFFGLLSKVLDDNDPIVKKNVINALYKFAKKGHKRVGGLLENYLNDKDKDVRNLAMQKIKQL